MQNQTTGKQWTADRSSMPTRKCCWNSRYWKELVCKSRWQWALRTWRNHQPIAGSHCCKVLIRSWQPRLCSQQLQSSVEDCWGRVNGISGHFKTYIDASSALESGAETLQAWKESLKRTTEDMSAKGSVSDKSSFKFARYINQIVLDLFQVSALTVGNKLK